MFKDLAHSRSGWFDFGVSGDMSRRRLATLRTLGNKKNFLDPLHGDTTGDLTSFHQVPRVRVPLPPNRAVGWRPELYPLSRGEPFKVQP